MRKFQRYFVFIKYHVSKMRNKREIARDNKDRYIKQADTSMQRLVAILNAYTKGWYSAIIELTYNADDCAVRMADTKVASSG